VIEVAPDAQAPEIVFTVKHDGGWQSDEEPDGCVTGVFDYEIVRILPPQARGGAGMTKKPKRLPRHTPSDFEPTCGECIRELRVVEITGRRVKIVRAARVIREVLEAIDNRCLAAEGPVAPTIQEIRPEEFRRLYRAAVRIGEASAP
jgi:putative component of toxin-antitoxin plasmid stabilization module